MTYVSICGVNHQAEDIFIHQYIPLRRQTVEATNENIRIGYLELILTVCLIIRTTKSSDCISYAGCIPARSEPSVPRTGTGIRTRK
jgi:hypothetical protein